MGKRKRKKGGFKKGTWLEEELYRSRAYLALKGFAPQLLTLFYGKREFKTINGKHVCTNIDNITMTYVEIENIFNRGSHKKHLPKDGISKPRFTRGRDDLMEKGFLKIVHHGGAYKKDKTIYAITDDWQWWRPGQVIYKRPKDSRQRGYRKPKTKIKSTHETVPIHTDETVPIQ